MSKNLARHLRSNLTEAEKKLWRHIRNKLLGGHRFRRQAELGAYVVDFVCFEAKVVVEIDGGQHADQIEEDATRTAWLETQGFSVIRFWNNEVTENVDGVLARLSTFLEA